MRDEILRGNERGAALILALFFTVLVGSFVLTGTLATRGHRQDTDTSFRLHGQALQFARSGLTEALTWFRRQTRQPVPRFEPLVDRLLDPPLLDTIDPEVGLVREYRIEGNVWGRYEVWRQWEADPDPQRLEWRRRMQARDVSIAHGFDGSGVGWVLRSVAYVYERKDSARRYDEYPNRVLAGQVLESEIVRMKISPPGHAALSVFDGNSAHVNTYGRVRGGGTGAGIFYPSGSGTPTLGPAREQRVTGSPSLAPTPEFDGSIRTVFGVTEVQLRGLADDVIHDGDSFPAQVPDYRFLFAEVPSIHFDRDRPLRGTGLLFIRGNVHLNAGSNSMFNGLLYVDGNLTVRAPCEINGTVICTGNVNIQGAGDYAELRFDEGVLDTLRRRIGQYRIKGATRSIYGE